MMDCNEWRIAPMTPSRIETPDGAISVSWSSSDGIDAAKAEETAAFIVRAVKCHDELVAALQGLRDAVKARNPHTDEPGWARVLAELFEADAALAKARGETP